MSRWREQAFPVSALRFSGNDPYALEKTMGSNPEESIASKILWQHPDAKLINKNLFSLVAGFVEQPEELAQHIETDSTPTAHRTYPLHIRDNWGEGIYVIKGVRSSVLSSSGFDITESTHFVRNVRFPNTESNEGGKQSATYEAHDIGGYLEIDKHNPGMRFSPDAPFWHPLLVAEINEKIYDKNRWTGEVSVDSRVASVRRFPYTHWRLEDVLNFDSAKLKGKLEIDKLRRVWGFENNSQVYLKAIERWGLANRMMMNASVRHRQVFNYYAYDLSTESPQFSKGQRVIDNKQYAWVNPNNISLDGATGDFDCHRRPYFEPYFDEQRGRHEAIGGLLMYLGTVEKLNSELIADPHFISSAITVFEQGLGKGYFKRMIQDCDFAFVGEVCENSAALHRTRANTYGIMPSRSPLDIYMNGNFLLPFMDKMAKKLDSLTKN